MLIDEIIVSLITRLQLLRQSFGKETYADLADASNCVPRWPAKTFEAHTTSKMSS